MKELNLAFYTYFYGSNNNISFKIPRVPTFKYNCYYYTNNEDLFNTLKLTKWIGIYDNKPTKDDLVESSMVGKHLKSMPHEYPNLKNYDYLVFLDNKIDKLNVEFIIKCIHKYCIEQNYALLLKQHWFIKDSVWNEYNVSMHQERYRLESEKYVSYIKTQVNKGLSENTQQHCVTGILVRNMKHDKIIDINTTWYKHIQECGIQCQISFHFVKQLFNDNIYVFK
jgi:hypothetical protein